MRRIALAGGGASVPVLGQGTWGMAEDPARRDGDRRAATGLDLGMTVVDTAEMYADGGAEELVGEAIAGRRDEVFLVDKVLPSDADRRARSTPAERACAGWAPTGSTCTCCTGGAGTRSPRRSRRSTSCATGGMIRYWGVSNLDVDDLEELGAQDGGAGLATDQVLYNLTRRGPEWDLLPWLRGRGVPVMAYSPIEQGRVLGTARSATSRTRTARPRPGGAGVGAPATSSARSPRRVVRSACATTPQQLTRRLPARTWMLSTVPSRRRAARNHWKCSEPASGCRPFPRGPESPACSTTSRSLERDSPPRRRSSAARRSEDGFTSSPAATAGLTKRSRADGEDRDLTCISPQAGSP